jgi:hypothetical protein
VDPRSLVVENHRRSALIGRIVAGISGITLLLLLTPGLAVAQNTGIAGLVKDTSGAVMPGVTVEAASPALIEKVRTTVTDGQGLYQIVDLRPGVYTVTFSLGGFSSIKRDGIELSASFTATVNAELKVGALEETVIVSGQPTNVDVRNVVQQKVLTEEVRLSLPTARSLQTMAAVIPGIVTTGQNRPSGQDVGGLSGDRGQIMIHGSRNGDMTLQLDGLSWNLALGNGAQQGFTLNPAEAEEYVYEVGGIAADTMTGGVRANVIPKTGGNRFTVFGLASYTSGDLQSNNLSDELRARGLQAANPIQRVYDYNGAVGGPLKRDRVWFFGSFRQWDQQEQVTGMFRPIDPFSFTFNPALGAAGNVDVNRPAIYDSVVRSYSARLTWQIDSKNKVSLYGAHQPRRQFPQFISATRSFEASNDSNSKLSSRLLLEAAFASPYNSTPEAESVSTITPDTISVTDTGTGYIYRAAPTYWVPYYYQPSAKVAASYITGAHAVKVGFDLGWGSVKNLNQRTNGGMNYTFVNGVPRSISVVLSPRDEQEREHHIAFYGQDQWTLKRVTINAGLRFDYQNQSVPAQVSGPGPFVPSQSWEPVADIVGWKDLSPRLGVSYDPFGDGKTAVKVTASSYNVRDGTAFASANNPLLFNATATRTWGDANSDFIPQPGELGPLSNPSFGTGRTTTTVDDAISHGWGVRPYNWEISTSVQRELVAGVSANLGYFRRWYGNFVVTDNQSIAPSDYDEYCTTAPTDARLGAVSGTRVCGLYDLTPAAFVRQPSNLRTRASNYGTQKETFDGIDVSVTARLPHRLQLFGGMSSGTSSNTGNALVNSTEGCFVVDAPHFTQLVGTQTVIAPFNFCDIPYPWRTGFRGLATIGLPWGVDVGATVQNNPGPEITANYTVNSSQVQFVNAARSTLDAGSANIALIKPGTVFGSRVYQLDLRLSKSFTYRGARIRAIADLGNLLNGSTVLLQNNTYGTNWQRPSYIMPGRLFKPTIEVTF